MQSSQSHGAFAGISKRVVKLVAVGLTILGIAGSPVLGGTQDDAIAMWQEIYRQAYQDLRFGSTFEKIEAARLFGQHGKSRYVRPLVDELNSQLDDPIYRKTPINDPFVKSEIAWALGEIGHPHAVPGLLQALASTVAILDSQIQANVERREKEYATAAELEQQRQAATTAGDTVPKVRVIILDPDQPGPFELEELRHQFPYSPDQFWNVSNRFKDIPAVDDSAEDHRILLEGATYMNLVRALLTALGEIGDEKAIEGVDPHAGVKEYLSSRYPFVRSMAAKSLGMIGSEAALTLLDQRYGEEPDDRVKVRIALAVLRNDKTRTNYYNELISFLKSDVQEVRFQAAVALRTVAMYEAIENLRAALDIEADPTIRSILEEAIHQSTLDGIIPVNY